MGFWRRDPEKSIDSIHHNHPDVPREIIVSDYNRYLKGSVHYSSEIRQGVRRWEYWAEVITTADRDLRSGFRGFLAELLDCPLVVR